MKILCELNNRGVLLTDCNIDANNVLAFLIDNSINGNFGFTCLTVTDNKLTLTSSDRNHAVDSLDACLKRNGNTLTLNDTRCFRLDRMSRLAINRAFAVNRFTECINNSAEKLFADRNGKNPSRSLNL